MPWRLHESVRKTWARNPLVGVTCELRFAPILKLEQRIADFQESVRAEFPGFETYDSFRLQIPLGSEAVAARQKTFRFTKDARIVSVSTSSLALEDRAFQTRDEFVAAFLGPLTVLTSMFSVTPTRLGLRYINLIDRARLARELGRNLAWADVVDGSFLGIPGQLSLDDEDCIFMTEAVAALEPGHMTVRHGLWRATPDSAPVFRLDVDRYVASGIDLDCMAKTLDGFASDIYNAFTMTAGPALNEWMDSRE